MDDLILQEAIELYKSGFTMMKVCSMKPISLSKLQRHLKKLGLSRSNKVNSRKYELNHQYFNKIDNEEKAYWLGFIYADGYVSQRKYNQKIVGISLAIKDNCHLIKLKKDIKATYEIKTYECLSYGKLIKYSRLLMTSQQMYEDLVRNGVFENKSLILKFPDERIVPRNLLNHFMRGYFDGDGSFSKSHDGYQFKLCGTKEFLDEFATHLGHPSINLYKRKKDNKNNYYISIGGRLQVINIGDFIYKNSTVKLNRKYSRYRRLLRKILLDEEVSL